MPPSRVPAPAHSDLSHRSPFVAYTGSWLAMASYHSWVPDTASTDEGGFSFAFDGTDFAVYGAWDGDTAAWIDVDGNSTWWHAPPPRLEDDGQVYAATVEPGFHRVSFKMAGGRMDLVKVVVGDGPIGPEPYSWELWHIALAASAILLGATRIIARKRRTSNLDVTSPSEKV
ncbi:hypothetical protein CC85DRAFT_135380 [Cutaneotrichosporon oleaginosum]|uniref:Uncharacterized protein n=1 Tax=Cutaneotrichosporon oleaginosum TaxID=879819 RepID=A0A0J0XWN3_9TREE|nr:uncharacterized protein CC85DRAFT_135380 [Cutaneotrichosporon oleaginosum]KLT45461.1 hypothetical protein CC85DRAFT_135380 [Cutaneotrichosporon oleaginosum]TXT14583.1 hypothetical protein COLE_00776 [Cutaneotrichosporon oleaginosum]